MTTLLTIDTFNPDASILAGMDQATLALWLAQARLAYMELMTGARVVTASYAQGDGTKAVQYTAADATRLMAFIMLLMQYLGMEGGRRRPIRFRYTT